MKYILRTICVLSGCLLVACGGGMPQLFWKTGDNTPDYARERSDVSQAKGRKPLDIPPELREKVTVPMPDKVATEAAQASRGGFTLEQKRAVAGKAVSLDARAYTNSPAQIFSTAIDAMTALNLPVQSVDSPSGTVTTEWIRKDSLNANSYVGSALNVFGLGPSHIRYRFVVRVLRMENGGTRLEIRTLGQQFINTSWVNKMIKRKVSNELFAAVEERLVQNDKKTDYFNTPASDF